METFCNGIIVNPVADPMKVLIIAVCIGAVHLVFGQLVHIYMGFRDGEGVDALLDVVPCGACSPPSDWCGPDCPGGAS